MLIEALLGVSTLIMVVGFVSFGFGAVLDYETLAKYGILVALTGAGGLGVTISLALLLGV
jgi:hypothetical protein